MSFAIAPFSLGFIIAIIVLVLCIIAFLGAIAATPQLILAFIALLAIARLT